MRRLSLLFFFTIAAFSSISQNRPKLVVGIIVDQMRQDYLIRFSDRFQAGGFKRLMADGYQFKNAHYNYTPTYTAPGHASIYTGTTPANHGIIGNDWYDIENDMNTYCVYDGSVVAVGGSERNGKMSPKNMQVSTITDQLMLSTNFQSKVIGVSIKDRSAILPAGHNPTGAYWFDGYTGEFMTSTYYTSELPQWVDRFNQSKKVNDYLSKTWNTLYPIESYTQSTQDNVPYERNFKGKTTPTFPYDLNELVKQNGVGLIRTTPFGNSIVLDFALAALENESLGEDQITDFLALSFSATDYIGHAFGPNAIELEDTYLRLDLEIKRLLDYLDKKFGDDYLVFLSADHGVTEVPSFLMDKKMTGGYLKQNEVGPYLQNGIEEILGEGEWITDVSNDQIYLNQELIIEKELNLKDVRMKVKEIILAIPEVQRAYTADELMLGNATDPFKIQFQNGFNHKMSGDIVASLKPGYLIDYGNGTAGTSHGSVYTYDSHVPVLFFGKGIKAGASVRKIEITDIAATLSMLLNISLPNASTGMPLVELFE